MSMLHCIALGAFIVLFGALLRGLGWRITSVALAELQAQRHQAAPGIAPYVFHDWGALLDPPTRITTDAEEIEIEISFPQGLTRLDPPPPEAPLRYAAESMIAMIVGAAIIGACALTLLAKAVSQ